jgi:hypothetical protein
LEYSSNQFQGLASRGKGLTTEIDQLEGKLSIYNIAKLLVDDKTFDLMDSFEEEGKRTRLSYHAFYESTHKRWMEWANDVETAMLDVRGRRSELARFRKLKDQINRFYSKREIDLPSIGIRMKEQVSIVERLVKAPFNSVMQRESLPKAVRKRSRLDRLVEKVERNPYYKLAVILSVILGLLLLVLGLLIH